MALTQVRKRDFANSLWPEHEPYECGDWSAERDGS